MKTYRIGQLHYVIFDSIWCIQEKKWWGWSTYCSGSKEYCNTIKDKLEKQGNIVI